LLWYIGRVASKTLTIRVPAKLNSRLDRLAKHSKKSQSMLAASAVKQFFNEQQYQQSVLEKSTREPLVFTS